MRDSVPLATKEIELSLKGKPTPPLVSKMEKPPNSDCWHGALIHQLGGDTDPRVLSSALVWTEPLAQAAAWVQTQKTHRMLPLTQHTCGHWADVPWEEEGSWLGALTV